MTRGSSFVDSLLGQKIAGRYIVDRLLGVGGMGIVAAGRYPELGQKVAIKFLKPEYADERVVKERFLREARVAAKVKSAHFVRVYDVGQHDTGVPYFVMEMLSGRDLSDELRARGQLPVEEAVDYILQACVGVAELHALGVVHRDLKPSNLFVTDRTIKVLDFGISKEQASETRGALTATDNVLGTPQYMSPEQIKHSKDVDGRADIWALGVILYELVTGKLPFVAEGTGVGELFARILYFEPQKPSEHRSDLPAGLEEVLLTCLTRDTSVRYANVGAFADALRPFASARSQLRIEAVHEVLATPHPEANASMPPPPEPQPAPNPEAEKSTVQVGNPQRKTPASEPLVSAPADAESIHASSVELGLPKKKAPALTAAIIGAAAIAVGAVAFVLARSNHVVATTEPPSPVPATSAVVSAAGPAVSPSFTAEPLTVPPPPSASSVKPAATPKATVAATKPATTPRTTATAKPTAAPASDPILDRK